jgi:hypothetical protein
MLSKIKKFNNKRKISLDYKKEIKDQIERQSGKKYNELGEFIGNVLDLYGLDIGKFGMGFKQGFKGMKEGDVLEVLSKKKGSKYFVKLKIYVKGDELYIEDEIIETKEEDYQGTRIKVIKREKQNKEEIKKYIRDKFGYVEDEKVNIFIYDKESEVIEKINEEESMRNLEEEVVDKRGSKNIYIVVDENGYEVIDEGKGMTRETMLDNLISFGKSTKSMVKEQKKAKLKYAIKDESSNKKKKGKIALTIQGVTIEDYEIQGYNICEELVIELGQAELGFSRDSIVINENFYKMLNIFIDTLILKKEMKIEDKIKIYNTLLELFKQKQELDKYKLSLLKTKMMEDIEEMDLYGKVILPSLNDIELLKLRVGTKRIIYVNEEIYPEYGMQDLVKYGLKKVENFKSNGGYELYLADFAQKEKIRISIGKTIILNKTIYENNDKNFLNLYLNYWIGYGTKPDIKGLIEEKEEKKSKDLSSDKEKNERKEKEQNKKGKKQDKEKSIEKVKDEEKKKDKKKINKEDKSKEKKQKKEKQKDEIEIKEEAYQDYIKLEDMKRLDKIMDDTKKIILITIYDYIDVQKEKKVSEAKIKNTIDDFLDQVLFLLTQNVDISTILDSLNILKEKNKLKYVGIKENEKTKKRYLCDQDGNVMSDEYTYIEILDRGSDWIYANNKDENGNYEHFVFRLGRRNVEKVNEDIAFTKKDLNIIGENIWIVGIYKESGGYCISDDKKIYKIFNNDTYIADKIVVDTNFFTLISSKGKNSFLKNGEEIDENLYDSISQVRVIGNNLWAIGIQNNQKFFLKNGAKVDEDSYDDIMDLKPIGNDLWAIGVQNNKYFLLKNGEKVERKGYDEIKAYEVVGGNLWAVVKQDNKYYLFKNEENLNHGAGIDKIDSTFLVGEKLFIVVLSKKKEDEYEYFYDFIYDGLPLEDETIYEKPCLRLDSVYIGNTKIDIVFSLMNSKLFILKDNKLINDNEYGEIKKLKVLGNNFWAIGIVKVKNKNENKYYLLKNGEQVNKGAYDHITEFNVIENDFWAVGAVRQNDKYNYYVLKNGNIESEVKEGYQEIRSVQVVGKDLWALAKDKSGKWHILKNGKKVNEDIYSYIGDFRIVGNDVWTQCFFKNRGFYFIKNGELIQPNDENKEGFNQIDSQKTKAIGNDLFSICIKKEKYFLVKNGKIKKELVLSSNYYVEANLLYVDTLDIEVKEYNEQQKENLKKVLRKYRNNKFLVEKIMKYYLHDLDELFYEYEFMQEGLEYIEPSEYNKILNVLHEFREQLNLKKIEGILAKKTRLEKEAYYKFLFKIIENKEQMDNKTFFQYFTRLNAFMTMMQEEEEVVEELILKQELYKYIFEKEGSVPEDLFDYVRFFKEEDLDIIETKEYEGFEFKQEGKLVELLESNENKGKFERFKFRLKKTRQEQAKRRQEDIKRRLDRTVEGQKINKDIVIRELFQNSKDVGTGEFDINEYTRVNGGTKEHILEFTDYVGMDKKTLLEKLLMPGSSSKRLKKGTIGGFGIGFYTVFQYSNVVEIETEKNRKVNIIRLELKEDEKTGEKYIEYKMLSSKVSKKRSQNHTSIRLIKKYDTKTKMKHTLEYFTRGKKIQRMIGGNVIKEKKIWEEKKRKSKSLSNKQDKKEDVTIKYNGKDVISKDKKRTLLSSVRLNNPRGELKISLNPVKMSSIEKNGLYINKIAPKWLKLVPTVVLDSLQKYMDRLVIEFPTSTMMTLTRHDISNNEEREEIKKAIAIGFIKALVNLHLYRNERIIGLSEDSLYSKEGVEENIIQDAENINIGNWKDVKFEIYRENRQFAIKLLFLLKPNEKSNSLYEVKTSIIRGLTVQTKDYNKGFTAQIQKAERNIKLRNKSRKKMLDIKGNEVLENVRYFLLGLKGITGIGFEEIEFYEADNNTRASCGPRRKGKPGYRISLNYAKLKDDFEIINRAFKNNESIEEIIFNSELRSLLQTIIHEASHREEFKKYKEKGIDSSSQWTHGEDDNDDESFSSMMRLLMKKLLLANIKDVRSIIFYGNMISKLEKVNSNNNFDKIIDLFVKKIEIMFRKERQNEDFKNYGIDKLKYLLRAA